MSRNGRAGDYLELAKPRIAAMVCLTAAIGYFLSGADAPMTRLFWTLIGTALASGGASALNHCLERETDALMQRTRNRPIPAGRVTPLNALVFGIALVLSGVFLLEARVNLLASFLVLLTAFLYVLVYTPMKRHTWLNTFVGSIPGALPPVVGWAAASGGLNIGAYALFLILFAWQHPHFYALAWLYREDYARGGLKMLPVMDPRGERTAAHAAVYSAILLAVSLLPFYFGMSGSLYAAGAALLGAGMLVMSLGFLKTKSDADARKMFRASLVYFPALFLLILIDAWTKR